MKKILSFVLLALAVIAGCKKKENPVSTEPAFSDLIIGTWMIENQLINTNETFLFQLKPNGMAMWAQGIETEAGSRWVECSDLSYLLQDKTLIISGKNANEQSLKVVLSVSQIDQSQLTATIEEQTGVAGVVENSQTVVFQHITESYQSNILGFWHGKEITNSPTEAEYYWEFLSDNTYNFYYYDPELALWVLKEDNNGHYFLYAKLLVMNFTNSLLQTEEGDIFECWITTFSGNRMEWMGVREGGTTAKFEIEKSDKPPVTDYSSAVIGTWVNTEMDGVSVPTNEAFTMVMNDQNVMLFGRGYATSDRIRAWKESDAFIYSMSQNLLTINGVDAGGQIINMEMNILSISQETMTYVYNQLTINGEQIEDHSTYTLQRRTNDLEASLVGIWHGKRNVAGVSSEQDFYWEFYDSGRYDFYYYDVTVQGYVLKEDNNGKYLIYNDFLSLNAARPYFSEEMDADFECWNMIINADKMQWQQLDAEGNWVEVALERSEGVPGKVKKR